MKSNQVLNDMPLLETFCQRIQLLAYILKILFFLFLHVSHIRL